MWARLSMLQKLSTPFVCAWPRTYSATECFTVSRFGSPSYALASSVYTFAPERVCVFTKPWRVKIWVPGATDEARTVHIEYSVENALRFIDPEDSDFEAGHDELYWNVTGNEWEIPIQAATARIMAATS